MLFRQVFSFTSITSGGHEAVMNIIVLGFIFLSQQCGQSICQKASKPNIVMVMSDAFDGRLSFDPGSKLVQLPYTNYLRQLGSTFLNAYTNSPICCPSRAAMWSGQFVHLTQSWNNYKCLDGNATTWMDLLKENGYRTKMIGKLDYTSGAHSVSNRVEAWTRDVQFLLRQEGRPVSELVGNKSTVKIMSKDWENTDKATQWIHQTAAPTTPEPFALYLGLNLPHPYKTESLGPTAGGSTFRTSPYWLTKVNSDLISVPKWLPLAAMHPVDYYSTFTKNCSGVFTDDEVKSIRAFYYAMCAEADAMLGQVISALRETGVLNNTVVIFTADHGELAMEHRQFYKMSMFEGSSHVPLLIMGPGLISGQQVNQLVSLVDLYPTVLEIAGISAVGNLSGQSLLPLLSTSTAFPNQQQRAWAFSEYHGCNVNASTYMLRSDQWKYITYADGLSVSPQLFGEPKASDTNFSLSSYVSVTTWLKSLNIKKETNARVLVRRGFILKWHSRLAKMAGATKAKTSEFLESPPQILHWTRMNFTMWFTNSQMCKHIWISCCVASWTIQKCLKLFTSTIKKHSVHGA